jgi:3-hydroxyisobutyrate dehydrogenase
MVDFSSITPDATRDFADTFTNQRVHWIDSPVSGGVMGAENGTLILMAGGENNKLNVYDL